MKKIFTVAVALAMVVGFAMTASAAEVQVTLTSPTITKAEDSCEKAGAVTFEFPPGSVLNDGDWWYMDLPNGATLCKDIDYIIAGQVAAGPVIDSAAFVDTLDPTVITADTVNISNFLYIDGGLGSIALGGTGPVQAIATGPGAAAAPVVGNISFRVVGQSGSRRVTIYVADDTAGSSGGVNGITVLPDTVLTVKILDGAAHVAAAAAAGSSRILIDRDGDAFDSANANDLLAGGQWRAYGQTTSDTFNSSTEDEEIDVVNFVVPHVENTLCINAEDHPGDNLFVSFASKNDEFTFSGDSQIAHAGGGNAITMETCAGKAAADADEILIGEQNDCQFDYDAAGFNGYCRDTANQMYMSAPSTFGEIDELYDVEIEILTSGVYFTAGPAMTGFLATESFCEGDLGSDRTPLYTLCAGNDCTDIDVPDASCSVDSDAQVDRVYTEGGAITMINNFTEIGLNWAPFVYDTSIVDAGDEVDVQITLMKYPCGAIWNETVTLGTFVDTCGQAAGATNLLYPWLPGSSFAGWWGGYVVTNGSAAAGIATLTATDSDGNCATYVTEEIAGQGHFNASFLTVDEWTQCPGNAADFDGSQNYIVAVDCEFGLGAGFAMIGNSTEGVGYTAETDAW